MNITGKRQDQNDLPYGKDYELPSIVRNDDNEIPLGKAVAISAVAHPLILGLLWLLIKGLILLLTILGITLPLFDKPQPKIKDIEFVLVNKPEEKPINPNTKYRSDRNSRAGGKHDPNKPISEPEPKSAQSTPAQPAAAQRPSVPKRQPQMQQPAHQPQKQMETDRPVPPRPRPNKSFSRPRITPPHGFNIPVPIAKAPKSLTPEGGPVTSGPIGYSSPNSSPAPVMSHGGSSSGSSRGRSSSGYSTGGGNAGNPSPGNPSGRPGIDAVREPDFGPYMRDLQRRIKRNWEPPKGNESKRVVLLFKVSKDGRLLSLRVQKSSGNSEADKAAMSAVELTAPFRPLPAEYRGSDIDIQFTFDYNVFGIGGGRY